MIGKLEMLLALAKEEHFGRAAETLGITQPTLSTGLKQLEAQLGVKLVQRGSRFGGLTPEGQRALEWARKIVGDTRHLRQEMRYSKEGLSGHLRLAVIPTALTWAARLAGRFEAEHPNVGFTILSRSSSDILQLIDNLDADAGITYLDNEPLSRVSTVGMYREHYAFVCRKTHDLAKRESLRWRDLGGLRMCLLTPDMQNRRIINRNLIDAGMAPDAMIESNSTIVLANQVIESDFVTILPLDLAQFLAVGHDLAVVQISGGGVVPEVGLIAMHQEPYTPVLQELMKTARSVAKTG